MRTLFALFLIVSGCATCPIGDDVSAEYEAERIAAGAPRTRVIELPLSEVREVCGANARGCWCVDCGTIVIPNEPVQICPGNADNCWYQQSEIVLHEFVHVAFGGGTADHPPEFEIALQQARVRLIKP